MWLDAIVTAADLQTVADQLTPATVPLGDRGHLFFDAPVDVSLVAERGLRLRCHAKLLWPVLGIDVAITIRSMTLIITPAIETRNGERVIVLAPEVDALDLALLPDIGDAEVRAFINRELQEKRVELPWKYKETLDHRFKLPDWFRSAATFDLRSNGAAVKVTNDSIGLAIGFRASVEPIEQQTTAPPTERPTRLEKNDVWVAPRTALKGAALVKYRRRRRLFAFGLAVASSFCMGCLVGLGRLSR